MRVHDPAADGGSDQRDPERLHDADHSVLRTQAVRHRHAVAGVRIVVRLVRGGGRGGLCEESAA